MELPQPGVIETGDFQNLWIKVGLIMVLGKGAMTKERDEQCFFFFGFSNNLWGVFGN